MSTQDQQVRQACHAIAAQVFLVAPHQLVRRSNANKSHDTTDANTGERTLASSSTGISDRDSRAEELRCHSDAVARDAMTLYRLCHRQGGHGVVIVPSSFSSGGGGGGGGGGAVEEAAYCVCAAIMSREALLWESLVRRAQLLRPRRPTLGFAPPVMVPPVVVKEVVKFYGRSRHLVPISSSSVGGGAGMAADAGVLSAQQAEAVAAAFFFKTMSAVERRRRRDIFEVQIPTPSSSAPHEAASATRANKYAGLPAKLLGRVDGVGQRLPPPPSPPPPLASSLSPSASKSGLGYGSGGAPAPPRCGSLPLPLPFSSSLLAVDDWAGWGGAKDFSKRNRPAAQKGTFAVGQDGMLISADGAVGDGWLCRSSSIINSSSDSGSDSDDISRSHFENIAGSRTTHNEGGGGDSGGVKRSRKRAKRSEAVTDAAVLERLYHLAITPDAGDEEEAEAEDQQRHRQGGENGDTCLLAAAGSCNERSGRGAPGAVSAVSSQAARASLFVGGKDMSLVGLAAAATQVQDALHWGKLTALVRCPILFRGLSAPHLFLRSHSSAGPTATTAALTAESITCLNNLLGSAYSSSPPVQPPALLLAVDPAASVAAASHPMIDQFVLSYGSAGSFLCPSRLRPLSLLPRPPSLVTDTFLWTRLLICSAWLTVYSDSLVDDDHGDDSSFMSEEEEGSSRIGSKLNGSGDVSLKDCAHPGVRSSPLVQEVVAYCVAVVKEARAISSGMHDTSATPFSALGRQRALHSPSPAFNTAGSSSNSSAVCCPVCDRLVKEQQPVLWWSTLCEDRAVLREQVRALLENGSATEAEAQVAAAVAADGLRDARGGRAYAAPQLSGSGADAGRVAALQTRWAMYVAGVPNTATVPPSSTTGVDSDKSRRGCGGGVQPAAQGGRRLLDDDTIPQGEVADTRSSEYNGAPSWLTNMGVEEVTDTLWAALAQRVAATVDLFSFLSTHPLSNHVRRRSGPTSTAAAAAAGVRKRRRRAATSSDDTTEESTQSSDEANSSGSTSTGDDAGLRRHPSHHHSSAHPSHLHGADAPSITEKVVTTPASTPSTSSAFQGSRHAQSVAEAWERLLRRRCWVDAVPPRLPLQSHSHHIASPTAAAVHFALPHSSTSPASPSLSPSIVGVYEQWAESLVAPAATPTSQQAAALRRRLSGYRLIDVVRNLVLGRGGQWRQYATLMFGADALLERSIKLASPEPPAEVRTPQLLQEDEKRNAVVSDVDRRALADASHSTGLCSSGAVAAPPPLRRAASMSLLEEDLAVEGTAALTHNHDNDDMMEHDSLLLVEGPSDEEEERAGSPQTRISSSPPALTSLVSFSAPVSSPPPPLLPRPVTQSTFLSSPVAGLSSTPTRKFALPSIPLHVSPFSRQAAAAVQSDAARSTAEDEALKPNETTSQTPLASVVRRAAPPTASAATAQNAAPLGSPSMVGSAASPPLKRSTDANAGAQDASVPHVTVNEKHEACGRAVPRAQLRAQQAAIRNLLRFHPRFPPLREEDAVLECGSCFSLFHQDCVAPVQRDLVGQVFLCHTCRLRWARPYVEQCGGGGLIQQSPGPPFGDARHRRGG
jgi:hypothetical protein